MMLTTVFHQRLVFSVLKLQKKGIVEYVLSCERLDSFSLMWCVLVAFLLFKLRYN